MHGGRRDSEVLLHFGLRWRTSVDFAVVINESQILTLFVRVSFPPALESENGPAENPQEIILDSPSCKRLFLWDL